MVSDSVIAIVPENALPAILAHVHRSGLGHTARVLRPKASSLREQLRRAGVPVEAAPDRLDEASTLLFVMAAARSLMAANLALTNGASATWIVSRSGEWRMVDDHVVRPAGHPLPAPVPPVPAASLDETATDTPGSI